MAILKPGARLGRYVVGDFVAHGGMADVYRVTAEGVVRAAKVLREQEVRERFVSEARIQLSLDHPHLVRAYELLEADGVLALLLEYVPGRSLEGWVNTSLPSFSSRERVLLQVIEAVGYAHARGLVHRDLKPGNVLVVEGDDGPIAKVTDFGLAKEIDGPAATRSGAALGTPRFMAPEQFRDAKRVDHRADLWSLGVLTYELFTGRAPFHRESLRHVFAAVLDGRFEDPEKLGAPPHVCRAIRACLQVDPERRPRDAAALAALLLEDTEDTLGPPPESEVTVPLDLPALPASSASSAPTWADVTLVEPGRRRS